MRNRVFLLDHVRHRNFGVLLKHAGHQAITSDIINALRHRAGKHETQRNMSSENIFIQHSYCWTSPPVSLTWLMSLVHAAFSWREGARRTTEKDWPSGGSTTTLNSRWLKPWPAALSAENTHVSCLSRNKNTEGREAGLDNQICCGTEILTVLVTGI